MATGQPTVRWGHSVLEPDRAHVRDDGAFPVGGVAVGFAICGVWLVGDLPDDEIRAHCSTCLALLSDSEAD